MIKKPNILSLLSWIALGMEAAVAIAVWYFVVVEPVIQGKIFLGFFASLATYIVTLGLSENLKMGHR